MKKRIRKKIEAALENAAYPRTEGIKRANLLESEIRVSIQQIKKFGTHTTGDVAQILNCSTRWVQQKLKKLEDTGIVVPRNGKEYRIPEAMLDAMIREMFG